MSETATGPAAPVPAGPGASGEAQVRLPVAVLAVVATVVVALLAVALAVRADADRLPVGPPRDPPALAPAPPRLAADGRTLTLDELSVTLAGPPFTCNTGVDQPPSAFAQLATCSTVVHEDYDGKGDDWTAVTGVGVVSDQLVHPDLGATTKDVFDALVAVSFSADDHATLAKQSRGPAEVPGPSGAAWTQQADVRVKRTGLATPYDRLVVIVVRLQSGAHVAFFSDFPHDGSKRALQAVVDSVGTLEAR